MAQLTYRGWHVEPAYIGWEASHPDFGGPGDNRSLHAMTRDALYTDIDEFIDDDPDRGTVPFNVGTFFGAIGDIFARAGA